VTILDSGSHIVEYRKSHALPLVNTHIPLIGLTRSTFLPNCSSLIFQIDQQLSHQRLAGHPQTVHHIRIYDLSLHQPSPLDESRSCVHFNVPSRTFAFTASTYKLLSCTLSFLDLVSRTWLLHRRIQNSYARTRFSLLVAKTYGICCSFPVAMKALDPIHSLILMRFIISLHLIHSRRDTDTRSSYTTNNTCSATVAGQI
jgi:hypothetical protein